MDGNQIAAMIDSDRITSKPYYTVIVSNIGTVHSSLYKRDAEQVFNDYVVRSREKIGRASGETVTLLYGGEIVCESDGSLYIGEVQA